MNRLPIFLLCFVFTPVFAHPGFENTIVKGGATFKADLLVTHGCGNSPTIKIVVDVPEAILAITPGVKPGWNVELVESPLTTARTVFGKEVSQYTSKIIWSGGVLSSDYFDVFPFIVLAPQITATLYFPTTQHCVEGTAEYIAIPDASNKDEHLPNGAPSLIVVPGGDGSAH